jgi:hypothetical protein
MSLRLTAPQAVPILRKRDEHSYEEDYVDVGYGPGRIVGHHRLRQEGTGKHIRVAEQFQVG